MDAENFVTTFSASYGLSNVRKFFEEQGEWDHKLRGDTPLNKGWECTSQQGWRLLITEERGILLSQIPKASDRAFD